MTADGADPRRAPASESPDDTLYEQRVSGERVFEGALLDVRRDRARLPDGSVAVREYIVHPGAVLVIPVLEDGRVIVERQFRYPHNRTFIEFPAGKLDAGETALDTAGRELIEEAGYAAIQWTRLGVIHPVISYSTEAIDIYVARGLTQVGAKLDAGEFLEVSIRTEADLYAALDAGGLTDAKTLAALALYSRWMTAAERSIGVRISGLVQGVGFRDWTLRRARTAGVAGWVRNHRDGTVEARFQGSRAACDRLVDGCQRGPPAAAVERVEVTRCRFDAALGAFEHMPSA